MKLSTHALEAMGFRQMDSPASITARFYSCYVYEIRGFLVEADFKECFCGKLGEAAYKLSIGTSVNDICRILAGEGFVDNEEDWQNERKCTPPYLVVFVGPTKEFSTCIERCKEDPNSVITYESFTAARDEINRLSSLVMPSLVTALSCKFSLPDSNVRFMYIEHSVFGITRDNKKVFDIRIKFSGHGYVSRKLQSEDVRSRTACAVELCGRIDQKVAAFYFRALSEEDGLKKFLSFFLSIEIEIHRSFKKIDLEASIPNLLNAPKRAASAANVLFGERRGGWTTLRERFIWCVLCSWTHLSDSDVEDFIKLKAVRDDIAHGSIATPPAESIAGVERLASKLQQLNCEAA